MSVVDCPLEILQRGKSLSIMCSIMMIMKQIIEMDVPFENNFKQTACENITNKSQRIVQLIQLVAIEKRGLKLLNKYLRSFGKFRLFRFNR